MFDQIMIIPKHCSEVCVINVGKDFSSDKVMEDLIGKLTFYLTKYVILRERDGNIKSGERSSILKLRTEGEHILRTIIGGEVIVYPDNCTTVVDPTLDEFELNQIVLRAASARLNDDIQAVVLSGRNENVTFVYLSKKELKIPIKIMLVDVVPPKPSRLDTLAKISMDSRLISEHIKIQSFNVDASEVVKDNFSEGRVTFTPCPTEEILRLHQSSINFANIVERSKSCNDTLSVDLIGCSLSYAALNKLKDRIGLNLEVSLTDICPLHTARKAVSEAEVEGFIVRCCKVTEDPIARHLNNKPLMILPWAPSIGEFVKAIDELIKQIIGLDER